MMDILANCDCITIDIAKAVQISKPKFWEKKNPQNNGIQVGLQLGVILMGKTAKVAAFKFQKLQCCVDVCMISFTGCGDASATATR